MIAWPEAQTYAGWVVRCATCDGEVGALSIAASGKSVIAPCGHEAKMIAKPNPWLPER